MLNNIRLEAILGWITLVMAFVFYYLDGYGESTTGLFLNSMALGFFIVGIYKDLTGKSE